MLQPLQKVPVGLLEAFNLKTQGVNPIFFGDTVYPFADVLDFYLNNRLVSSHATQAAAVFPQSLTHTVAQFGPWRIKSLSCFAQLTAAGPANAVYQAMYSIVLPIAGAAAIVLSSEVFQAPAAGFPAAWRLAVGGMLPFPLIVPSGTTISVTYLSSDAAGTSTMSSSVMFESLNSSFQT